MAKIELALECSLDDLKKAFQDTSEDALVKFIKSLLNDLSLEALDDIERHLQTLEGK